MIEFRKTSVTYEGDGVTRAFPFSFVVASADHVRVSIYDVATESVLEVTQGYFVDEEAQVVYYPGYAPGQAPAVSAQPPVLPKGKTITIYRKTPIEQVTALGNKFPLPAIESMADKATAILQEFDEMLGRTVKLAAGDPKTAEQRLVDMQTYVAQARAALDESRAQAEKARELEECAEKTEQWKNEVKERLDEIKKILDEVRKTHGDMQNMVGEARMLYNLMTTNYNNVEALVNRESGITTAQIQDYAVTEEKLSYEVQTKIVYANRPINAERIEDQAVTMDKLRADVVRRIEDAGKKELSPGVVTMEMLAPEVVNVMKGTSGGRFKTCEPLIDVETVKLRYENSLMNTVLGKKAFFPKEDENTIWLTKSYQNYDFLLVHGVYTHHKAVPLLNLLPVAFISMYMEVLYGGACMIPLLSHDAESLRGCPLKGNDTFWGIQTSSENFGLFEIYGINL